MRPAGCYAAALGHEHRSITDLAPVPARPRRSTCWRWPSRARAPVLNSDRQPQRS